ncbi:MAG: dipeptidase [Rikenellaceae bacterium]
MEQSLKYINDNKERFLNELFELLRIPSISAESEHKGDMISCAEHLKASLLSAGATKAEVCPTEGNPVVYAEKIIGETLPTVLVYCHYDVMPVAPLELWDSAPFEPEVREGKIWGRGADDDKGQGFMHVKAFEALVSTGELPCNVKFMLEGEEEIGSPSLEKWCSDNKEMLKSDVILVSDTSMISMDTPSVTCGLRGISYVEVEVTGPSHDLHSGLFGGAVANPLNVLSKMIASLTDEDGKITIDGFYDDVIEFTPEQRAKIAETPYSEEEYKNGIGVNELSGEKGYSTIERSGTRPSLDVNGIWGGYTAEGSKTIIPSKANAKISMRLVANQNHEKAAELFEKHFKKIAPPTVTVKVDYLHGGAAYNCPDTFNGYIAAERAMEVTMGKKPLPFYSGGSIPIITTFEKVLGVKSVLMGFGLRTDAIHSPNENFPLENFYKGIETIVQFYKEYSQITK